MDEATVGLFFYVDGSFYYHGCHLENAEPYGDCLIFPMGHFDIWEENYRKNHFVDFDFYPRGRIIYLKSDDTFVIYHDKCIPQSELTRFFPFLETVNAQFLNDEHYRCSWCNEHYCP